MIHDLNKTFVKKLRVLILILPAINGQGPSRPGS